MLHGSSASGSAPAAADDGPMPALIAPANTMPRPSSARRSISPFPAAASKVSPRGLRYLHLAILAAPLSRDVMNRPLLACCGSLRYAQLVHRINPANQISGDSVASPPSTSRSKSL